MKLEKSVGKRGGVGGFNKDDSSNLEDMNYAEKLILSPEVLEMLSQMTVLTPGDKEYMFLKFDESDFKKIGYDAESTGSFIQRVNSVFALYRMPYKASPEASKDAPLNKRGYKIQNIARVFKYSNEFDASRYATVEADKHSKNENRLGKLIVYEDPTEGMQLRAVTWLKDVYPTLSDELKDVIGIEPE